MDGDIETEPYPGYWSDVAAFETALLPRDPVDQVADIATLVAVHTAEQYVCVAAARRDAMATASSRACTDEMIDRSLRLELAAALRITEYAAGDLMARSTALVERYPRALEALGAARITDQHARFLVDVMDAADPAVRARLVDRAVRLAEDLPAGTFRRRLRDLVAAEAVQTLVETRERALAQRRVHVVPAADGMSVLTAHLPSVEAHAIFDRLTRMAAAMTGRRAVPDASADASRPPADDRSLDQVRADVLCDLLIDGRCEGHSPSARGIRPTVVVTVPALSLREDAHGAGEPAQVEGLGPIPIERARELSGGARGWMRVLTHPETGAVLSVGRRRYDPPPELRRLVRWRAERCMAPGCVMPASRCEIDHTLAWSEGGATAADNLAPLCPGHHKVKHHGGWTVVQVPDSGGVLEWTSPYGRRYLVEPERRTPVFRHVAERTDDAGPPPF
ncbi:DUF222 domain-containing protein [Microbacterium hominis]|uniref:HNH endonuclease signature motif containing protein n=1 Tax=Microbacterium hominis TaxID=162426 RepID=UPI001964E0F1|nr:HNH endonuclease signature motif containing protein [Microbacterium hominis]QRY41558.1 DUF222 domain-containing protein [Microbacterium hominis]